MKTPPQVRQRAIFRTRLPKRHPFRVDGMLDSSHENLLSKPPTATPFQDRVHPQVQDPNFSGLESWKHLPKWGNVPFSRLDSRKDSFLGWMACFSGLESPKPALQTIHHHSFSRPESWKPSVPRSKIRAFQDSSHENTSPSEATCHFQDLTSRKDALLRVDGLFLGTGVTKTSPPNHPPPLLFKTRVMKTIHPQVQDQSFSGLESWKHLPKWGNMPFSRLDSRKDTLLGWMACVWGLESRKPAFQTTRHHPFSRPESWKPSPGPKSKLFRNWVMKTLPQVPSEATCHFQDSTPEKTPLGWMACFSGLRSRKPAFQTTRHHPFSRPESWKPRSKLFRTWVMKTLPQVRQRFPKRHPLRWMACCFRNWSHENLFSKPPTTTPFQDPSHENYPSPGPRSELAFQDRVMRTPPQVRQHAIFKTRDWSHESHLSKPPTTTPFQDPRHENHTSQTFEDSSHENISPSKATCHFQDSTPEKTPP